MAFETSKKMTSETNAMTTETEPHQSTASDTSKVQPNTHHSDPFDVRRFTEYLVKCKEENLDLYWYIEAYTEVNKLLGKLNILFTFIVHDISNKLSALSHHLNSSHGYYYRTIESMLDYEITNKILDNRHSGGRNLLPLNRGLKFVIALIEIGKNSHEGDKMSTMATAAYDATLAEFHVWPVRQAVHAAFLTLPNRRKFLSDLLVLNVSQDELMRIMDATVIAGRNVLVAVEDLYAERNILKL